MLYKTQKNIRIPEEMNKRLKAICNHFGMKESDAIRDAIKTWVNDKEWVLKVKGWFVEEEKR